MWFPVLATAAESIPTTSAVSPTSFPASSRLWSDAPANAHAIAPILRQVIEAVTTATELEKDVKELRTEQDGVKTHLTAVQGELQVVERQREQVGQQVDALAHQQQARIETLRKELEAKLVDELARSREQMTAEQTADFTRQVQVFEARQHDAIAQSLDQEVFLKERELEQLSQEIDVQAHELVDRLARLDANSSLATSLEHSTTEAIAKRKAQLQLKRQQLGEERDARLVKQRQEFIDKLRQQQLVEQERRLTLKQASLRSAMAELLHKAQVEDAGKLNQARQALEETSVRHAKLSQQQALFAARVDGIRQELTAKIDRMQGLEAQRKSSLTQLEQAFQQPNPGDQAGTLAWFSAVIRQLAPEVAAELTPVHQRVVALAEQERRLREQRRLLRERQLALQVSREVESQYQQLQEKQRQDRELKTRRAEELLVKANQFVGRGQYDEALGVLAQAQALNPPQLAMITTARDELIATRARAQRQAETARIEQLFTRAMKVFEAGRYDEAVTLFQQVIEEEAAGGQPGPMAGGRGP